MTPELLVVGAGPSGVSAALWAHSLGLKVEMIESGPTAGGQLHLIHFQPENLAGSLIGNGPAVARRLADQLREAEIPIHYDTVAVGLDTNRAAIRTSAGDDRPAAAILIATGVRRRRLDVPGERELEGRGVSFSATHDRARFAGEEVVVVGGGDAAYENALLLAEVGCHVTVIVRGRPRARPEFRDRVAAESRVEVLQGTRVAAVVGGSNVSAVSVESDRGRFELPAAAVVIKIGALPNTEWCAPVLEHDAEAYLLVDEQFGTSDPRVWAAGDVTKPALAGIAVASGQGALAVSAVRSVLREP